MCGIPHHSSQIYIEKLVNLGYKVGICEQLEDAKNVKGIVKRDVVQVISKGTVINDESLIEYENNYIGNLVYFNQAYGLSYTDISTGEIIVQIVDQNISKVVSEVVNIGLKEVVVTDKVDKNITSILERQFKLIVTTHETYDVPLYNHIYNDLEDVRMIETIKHILSYIDDTQKRNLSHFQKAVIRKHNQYLKMDLHTKRNLELVETLRLKQRTNSLIWLLDKTKTAMGSRLLKNILKPH